MKGEIFMAIEVQYTADIILEGTTPLLMQKFFQPENNNKATSKNKDYSEEWRKMAHTSMTSDQLIMPQANIEHTIAEGGRDKKLGKKGLHNVIPKGMEVSEFEVPIYDSKDQSLTLEDLAERDWLFTTPVSINKNMVMRTRPCLHEWRLYFTIEVTNPSLTPETMKDVIEDAGYLSGLGAWRPSCPKSGKFGRFNLQKFDVNK